MPKRSPSPATGRETPPAARQRRIAAEEETRQDIAPRRPQRSPAMRLAGEVERLQAELAAARARIAELEACAEVDPLTGLLNRRGFDRALQRALAYVGRYRVGGALVYLDLDRLKPINDRFGHAVGDQVLCAAAAALRRIVRGSDVVGRIGGDEFVVLLWNVAAPHAQAKAAALEAAVAASVTWHGGRRLSVGASGGVAMLEAGISPEALLARADAAMYRRKAARQAAGPGEI